MINARKEGHGAVEVADPDFCGARVEIERAFFGDFGSGVGRGENLDADSESRWKEGTPIGDEPGFLSISQPDDIGASDLAVASKDIRLLNCGELSG